MSKSKNKRLRSKEEWSKLITEFHTSGLSRKEFCKQHKCSTEYFYKLELGFSKHLSQSSSSNASFVPIKVFHSHPSSSSPAVAQPILTNIKSTIKINFTNGVSVEFINGCSCSELSSVKDLLCS